MKSKFLINRVLCTAICFHTLLSLSCAQYNDSTKVPSPIEPAVSVWGYVDAYFGNDFSKPQFKFIGQMVSELDNIYSFNRNREFNINHGILGIKFNKEKVRASFSLHSGSYVFSNYANEPTVFKNIYDAYIGYNLTQKLWVEAGVFTSHIGSESSISYDNLTLSRSIMADNTPYYESGVRFIYEPNKKISLTGIVLNGWQNIFDFNKNISLGTQIQFKPSDKVVLNWSTFIGKEPGAYEKTDSLIGNLILTDTLSTMRLFNDFYGLFNISDNVTLLTAFDIGWQKVRNGNGYFPWYGPNVILKYKLNDKYAIAGRVEYYHDRNGVIIFSGTPRGFQTFMSSLGFDCRLVDNVLWRTEGRIFLSKDEVYITDRGTSNKIVMLLTSLAFRF